MEFNTQMLEELCDKIIDCPHSTPKWTSSGVIVLRNQNIRNGRLDLSSASFTDELHYQSRVKRAAPQPGDIVLTREAPMGEVCIVPENLRCCLGQRQVLLRPKKEVNENYLFYALQSSYVKNQISWSEGTGSVVSNLRIPLIKQLKIPRFDKAHEVFIATLMSKIDKKIDLNRQTNNTLESIAQSLFKSWFIDFDPVFAKAQGCQPEGLDAETAALFPDGFEESELGVIPKGWKVTSLSEITSYLSRGISPKYTENGGVTVINQKCIRDNRVDLTKARRHDSTQRKITGRELLLGDVLINSTGMGTLGRVAQIISIDEPLIVDSHVTVVRAAESLSWNYLGLLLSRRQIEIEQLGEGSTGQTELSRQMLAKLMLIAPPADILAAFDSIIMMWFN